MKRRLRLLSSSGCLAVCSVVELTGYDHGVQHVASGLGAFAETGADDFDRNLGDLGGSGGGAIIVLLHDDFLLRKFYSEDHPEEPEGFFCFGCLYGRIASDDWKGSSRNIFEIILQRYHPGATVLG